MTPGRTRAGKFAAGGAYAVAAAALVAVGALGGVLTTRVPDPESLQASAPLGDLQVSAQEWADERPSSLTLTLGPALSLASPLSGWVTSARCLTSGRIRSGSVPFAVNGRGLLALATPAPLWRDLEVGAGGSDAAGLNSALKGLGYAVRGARVTHATLSAFDRAAAKAGAPTVKGMIPRTAVLWLPTTTVTPQACLVGVGTQVTAGDPLAGLPRPIAAATLTTQPADLAPGRREFVAGGHRLPLTSAGTLAPAGLAWLATHPALIRTNGDQSSVVGTVRLVSAVSVIAVPPVALGQVTGTRSCVTTPTGVRPVTIVGSQLGSTFVQPDPGVQITAVAVDPDRVQPCP